MLFALPFQVRSQDSDGGGFATPDSVEGTLAATEERQSEGALEGYLAWNVHLHRNLNQKQHIFAFQIAPVTAVKLLDSITFSRIR